MLITHSERSIVTEEARYWSEVIGTLLHNNEQEHYRLLIFGSERWLFLFFTVVIFVSLKFKFLDK